jgi:hypothetical protein
MKAELSFTFESLGELHDFTAKMAKSGPDVRITPPDSINKTERGFEVVPALAQAVPAEEPRTTKIRKTKAAPAPASEPALPATEETESTTVTVDDVRAAISAVNEKFGLVPARKVLNQFGVKRIPELKPEQYADFVMACAAVK